jgi:predicted glycosyltransferase
MFGSIVETLTPPGGAHRLQLAAPIKAPGGEATPSVTPGGMERRAAPRIVLYSHDTQGLGHMRRNLLIARTLMQLDPAPVILMIAGAREMGSLDVPPGVDCLLMPALGKRTDGQYQPRSLSMSLSSLIELRSSTIKAAIESFEPDIMIVDKVALGAFKELEPSLAWLRARRRTRCVLGLREVLDSPATVRREWRLNNTEAAIRNYYDAIWIYGDRDVYDPAGEYSFSPEVAAKIRYTGYLDRRDGSGSLQIDRATLFATLELDARRLALCLVGGGQDGHAIADAFARAELPHDTGGVIVTGPFMPAEARQRLMRVAADQPRLRVLTFLDETAPLLQHADSVVAMGGYNTICEVLAFEKRALIVPRVKPRREQLIRAERLSRLGVIDLLHPADLTPGALSDWLSRNGAPPQNIRDRIDLGGLTRLPALIEELLRLPHQVEEMRYAAC